MNACQFQAVLFKPFSRLFGHAFCLMLFVMAFSLPLGAQVKLACNKLMLEARQSTTSSCVTGDCGKVFIDVYLRTTGFTAPGTTTIELDYKSIGFNLALQSTTVPLFSSLNVDQTTACLNPDFVGSLYTVESNNVSIRIDQDANGEGSFPISMDYIELISGGGRFETRLYTLVVDGYSGETFSLDMSAYSMEQSDGGKCPNIVFNSSPVSFTVPQPTGAVLTELRFEFGAYDVATSTFPIMVKNDHATAARNIKFLDLAFCVTPDGLMQPITATILGQNLTSLPSTSNKVCFRVRQNVLNNVLSVPSGGAKEVGRIKVPGPIPVNRKANITVCFQQTATVRINTNTGATYCRKPTLGACESKTLGSDMPCDPSFFTVKIEPFVTGQGTCLAPTACGTLKVAVSLDWPTTINGTSIPSTVKLSEFKLRLDFDVPSGLAITDIEDACNSFPCASPNSPIACGLQTGFTADGSCASFDANSVIYCLGAAGTVNVTRGAKFVIVFTGNTGCVPAPTITEIHISPQENTITGLTNGPCLPASFMPTSDPFFPRFPLCHPFIAGNILDEDGDYEDEMGILITKAAGGVDPCIPHNIIVPGGLCEAYSQCVCLLSNTKYVVTPSSTSSDWLNGVSTYDLLLISKHILGVQALPTPYKMIAADANKSNTITTFDILELRKLILGIYNVLPGQITNWRHIPSDYVFNNIANPFANLSPTDPNNMDFPEKKETVVPNMNVNFRAIKVGDVNDSHLNCDMQRNGKVPPKTAISITTPLAKGGDYVTLPITYQGDQALAAIQMGFAFPASDLQFIGTAQAEVPGFNSGSFGLTKTNEGKILVSWFAGDDSEPLHQGQVMFYLTFKVLAQGDAYRPALQLDDTVLENLAWEDAGTEYALQATELKTDERQPTMEAKANGFVVQASPNPFDQEITLSVRSDKAQHVSVWLFDGNGVRKHYHETDLLVGDNTITIVADKAWASGLYVLKVRNGKEKAEIRLVKQ